MLTTFTLILLSFDARLFFNVVFHRIDNIFGNNRNLYHCSRIT